MVNREKMENWFYFGIFLIAMLFAFIAAVNLYSSVDSLIEIWFDYKYRPIFQALFSISVLAISLYFIRERLIK